MASPQETHQAIILLDKDRLVDECISALSMRMIELNQWQLAYGFNAREERFSRYRNKYYSIKKNRMNSRPGLGNPDLKLTGAFWKAFKTDIRKGVIDIYSTDPKAPHLEDKYAKIYGLTPESMNAIRADFLILFNERLRKEIGLQ